MDTDELSARLAANERGQAWLARKLGTQRQTVYKWVHGMRPIPAPYHDRIRNLLPGSGS